MIGIRIVLDSGLKLIKLVSIFLRIDRTPPCSPLTDCDSGGGKLSLDTIH